MIAAELARVKEDDPLEGRIVGAGPVLCAESENPVLAPGEGGGYLDAGLVGRGEFNPLGIEVVAPGLFVSFAPLLEPG